MWPVVLTAVWQNQTDHFVWDYHRGTVPFFWRFRAIGADGWPLGGSLGGR